MNTSRASDDCGEHSTHCTSQRTVGSRKRLVIYWSVRLLSVLISLLVALMIGEGIVRLSGKAPRHRVLETDRSGGKYMRCANPILGYEHRMGYPGINSHGLRDLERSVKKPPDTRRIIVLGDSVVEGYDGNLSAIETISGQLEQLCRDRTTEVLNFGVGGYCTLAEVELLRVRGLQFEPDVVVVVFVENDFNNFNTTGWELDVRRPAIVNWAFQHSDLFRLASVRLDFFGYGQDPCPARMTMKTIGDGNVIEGLKRLKEMSLEHNFETYVAIWPRFLDDRIVDMHYLDGSSELIIEVLAKSLGIRTARVSRYLDQRLKTQKRAVNPRWELTTGDGMHPNEKCSYLAAMALKEMLETADYSPKDSTLKVATASPKVSAAVQASKNLGGANYLDKLLVGALRNESYPAAIRFYETALQIDPNNQKAHCGLGRELLIDGQLENAFGHFQEALKIDATSAVAHFGIGDVYTAQRKFDDAISHYQQAIQNNPKSLASQVYLRLGLVFKSVGKLTAAVECFDKVLSIGPREEHLTEELKMIYQQQGDYSVTNQQYVDAQVVELATINLAWILATTSDAKLLDGARAVQLAEKVSEASQQKTPAIYDTLAAAYARCGRFEQAVDTATIAMRRYERDGTNQAAEKVRARIKIYRAGKAFTSP